MDASYEANLNLPFVLRAEDLEKLCMLVSNATGECEVTIRCGDGLQRRTSDVAEVLQYSNASNRQVQSISIEGHGGEPRSSIEVTFASRFFHTISVRVRAEESRLVHLRDSLETIFSGLRPWYAGAARRDIYGTVLTIVFLLYLTVAISMFFDLPSSATVLQEPVEGIRRIVFLTLAVAAPAAWLLNKLRAKVFPDACFAIGHGRARYDTQEKVRWGAVIGFAVSVAAGLVLLALQQV